MSNCYLVKYDSIDYEKALKIQQKIREIKEKDREYDNFVMVLQHDPPVFTIGRKGSRDEIIVSDKILKNEGIKIVPVQRGGRVTYHGPGQLVAYFLLDLIQLGIPIPIFVSNMEQTVITTIRNYGIDGFRRDGYPGVWVKTNNTIAKIAAIGARASKKITSHGLALNVNTNMNHFQMIIPCGITDYEPISIEQILGKKVNMHDVYKTFEESFEISFGIKLSSITKKEFEKRIE
ncbi:MAG: lipoyl(octanoyl) transferase LipB [Candidatus Heimdallarchaeaceae archaeon]